MVREAGSWVLCSIPALVWEHCPRPGGKDPLFGLIALLLPRNLPSLCRELGGQPECRCLQRGRPPSRPYWAPNPRALAAVDRGACPVVHCNGVGRGRRGFPRDRFVAPALLLSPEVRQTLSSGPGGLGRLYQSITAQAGF